MYDHKVYVPWRDSYGYIWWNETCAMVLDMFGLPGHKFIFIPMIDKMVFEFKDERDAFVCKLMLSDRICRD